MATYFHPKTGETADVTQEYARTLSTTAAEVRKILTTDASALLMPDTVKTLHDLLFQVILNNDIPVNKILTMQKKDSTKDLATATFEGMWTIAFALGVVPGYENITMYSGKVEKGAKQIARVDTLAFLKDQSLATSSKSGASDITFSIGDTEVESPDCTPVVAAPKKRNFAFCSVKFFRNDDKKSVDNYDVTNIISAALAGGYREDEFRVLILANNRDAVRSKFATALRRYITFIVRKDDKREGVLGREDLEAAFTRLREQVGIRPDMMQYVQGTYFGQKPAKFLSLRFHQELVVKKTMSLIKDGRKSILWGVVARGGKTYIAGGLIRDALPKCVFIVAGAYTETRSQFLTDLLVTKERGFQDFADYTVVDIKNDATVPVPGKKYIFFISLELLKMSATAAKQRPVMQMIDNKKIDIDMVFFDEVHKGGTTDLARDRVKVIAEKAVKIFMTATFIKPFLVSEYGLDGENLIKWGYEDIVRAKSIDASETLEYFEGQYGREICQEVLASQAARGNSLSVIASEYQKFPDIQFLTTAFSETFEANMNRQNLIDPKTGFRMSTLFSLGKDCGNLPFKDLYTCFTSPATVGTFLNYMGPANTQLTVLPNGSKVIELKDPNEHIINRISRTSQRRDDRLKNIDKEFKPHSQLWFVPQISDSENEKPLVTLMRCLASLIMVHPWFSKHFSVVCVSSGFPTSGVKDEGFVGFTNGGDNTKDVILGYEKKAAAAGRGLILIAGKMLTLGVSLPCVNVVALLDDSASSDLTYQKMFRALTENDGKKIGYIVDVNPLRTIKTLYDYGTLGRESGEAPDVTVLTNLYLIDEDQLFVVNEDGSRLNSKDVHDKLNNYLQSSRKVYKSIIAEAQANIQAETLADEMESMKQVLNRSKPEALGIASELAGEVPTGKERIVETKPKEKPVTATDDVQKLQSLKEMALTAMTLLAFLTTDADLPTAIERYKNNENNLQATIYNTIVDRGLVVKDAEKDGIKNVLLSIISKLQSKLTQPYKNMRAELSKFTGDQREVVEFIETNLMPKREQVAARGEIFTPLELVADMLSHLPDEVWKNPNLKWLDPANGIGNFPVVAFANLDKGLADVIPDPAVRHKHIVENMLFMIEYDETNVTLSKKLLTKMCGAPDCKLNVLHNDFFLATDEVLTNAFGVNRFDIVMGNPPYNAGGIARGGGAPWPKFAKRSFELINPNGYITFVHPQGWRKPFDTADKENQGKIWYMIRENKWNVHYLNLSDEPRFGKSTSILTDYYVIKAGLGDRVEYDTMFMGMRDSGSTTLPFSFIPNMVDSVTTGIVRKLLSAQGLPIKIIYDQSFKPAAATPTSGPGVPHYHMMERTGSPSFRYKEYATVPAYVNQPKVVLQSTMGYEKGRLFAFYADTPMGTTNHTMYMIADKPTGDRLVQFFNSDIVTFLMKITQFSMESHRTNEYKILNLLKLPDSLDFGLTPEEKAMIDRVNRPGEKKKRGGHKTPRKLSPHRTIRTVSD
jgi:Type III restriction enzyme, res subunit